MSHTIKVIMSLMMLAILDAPDILDTSSLFAPQILHGKKILHLSPYFKGFLVMWREIYLILLFLCILECHILTQGCLFNRMRYLKSIQYCINDTVSERAVGCSHLPTYPTFGLWSFTFIYVSRYHSPLVANVTISYP